MDGLQSVAVPQPRLRQHIHETPTPLLRGEHLIENDTIESRLDGGADDFAQSARVQRLELPRLIAVEAAPVSFLGRADGNSYCCAAPSTWQLQIGRKARSAERGPAIRVIMPPWRRR